jgi:tetratricopeptide (TPR) repeat protein
VWLRERRAVVGWISTVLMVGGVGWVAALWWRAGGVLTERWLDLGDRIASMASMVLTAVGVALAYLVWRRPRGAVEPEARPAPTSQRAGVRDAGPGVDPVGAGGPPRQLPRETSWFTGRAVELEGLLAMMPDPGRATAVVISSINGMAGIGKTALAVYAAHRMSGRFPDGQLFIDLHGFTRTVAPVEPTEALDRLLRMLGVPGEGIPAELDDRAALWRSTLAGRRMLIVLDNAATEAQVAPLLPGEPGCLVLVTSRRRLAGLEPTHTASLDTLPPADAVTLFAATAGHHHLTVQSRELVTQAVELCGRLPLAIRIAAARLSNQPVSAVAELVRQLRDEDLRLATLAEPAEGGRSVAAALQLSYQRLASGPRRTYRLLGLHPGPEFDAHAAAALGGTTVGEARRWLDRLRDAHLLQEPVPGRYVFHDLVRAHATHAAAVAESEPDRQAALDRLLDHYRHAAAAAMDIAYPYEREQRPQVPPSRTPGPDLPDPAFALDWLDTELPNLLAAGKYAAAHGAAEHIFHLSGILHRHLRTGGRHHDAGTLHHQALTTARAIGDRVGELDALNGLGRVHRMQGRHEQAADHHEQALQIARETGHGPGELDALTGLGQIHMLQGRHEQAAVYLRRALQIAREIGHRPGELNALGDLGHVHFWQGRYGEAADHFGQALQIARETGHRPGELNSLIGLGHIHKGQARYELATDHFQQGLRIARTIGDRTGQLNALGDLGLVHRMQGRHEQAADYFRRALQIARETGHRPGELSALTGLSHLHRLQGRYEPAVDHYQQLLTLAQEGGDRNIEFEAWQGMGRLSHATGHLDEAIIHHERALALAGELGQPEDQVRAHDGLAHAYHSLHQQERARQHWQHALNILTGLGIDHTEDEQATVAAIRSHLADPDRPQEPRSQSS